jgi:two-component system chemotaxis sensor kinase CheA
MDIVKRNISSLGGQIDIRSQSGAGTCIGIRLPLTLAIVDGMSVEIGGETFIVPLSFIAEAFLPQFHQAKAVAGQTRLIQIRDSYLPLLPLETLLGVKLKSAELTDSIVIVLDMDGRRAALPVDRLLGQQQVVIKSMEANYRKVPGVAAATVLGNGRVAFILDVNALVRAGEPHPGQPARHALTH